MRGLCTDIGAMIIGEQRHIIGIVAISHLILSCIARSWDVIDLII